MKKFTKGLLICCLLLALIGSGCVIAGFVMGITTEDIETAVQKYGVFVDFEEQIITIDDEVIAFPDVTGGVKEVRGGSYQIPVEKVREVELEIGGSDCRILTGDSEDIIIQLPERASADVGVNNGCLEIENRVTVSGSRENSLLIYLPKSYKSDRFNLEAGAGSVNIEGSIYTKEFVIEAGASVIKGSGRVFADTFTVELGAGSIAFDYVDAEKIYIENGAGQTKLVLDGNKELYSATIESAAGSVSYGEQTVAGLSDTYEYQPEDAQRSIEIESAIGEVIITFKEEI